MVGQLPFEEEALGKWLRIIDLPSHFPEQRVLAFGIVFKLGDATCST
jgi:hypothetical protein